MKLFKAIIEDNDLVYKIVRPAKSRNDFISQYSGNGDFVTIEETDDYNISLSKLEKTLTNDNWGHSEIDIILSTLQNTLPNNTY